MDNPNEDGEAFVGGHGDKIGAVKLLKTGALVGAVALALGAGFVASSRAQEENPPLTPWEDKYLTAEIHFDGDSTPQNTHTLVGFYRKAVGDPQKLQFVEENVMRGSDAGANKRFQLLQIEQNARLIESMKTRAPK